MNGKVAMLPMLRRYRNKEFHVSPRILTLTLRALCKPINNKMQTGDTY